MCANCAQILLSEQLDSLCEEVRTRICALVQTERERSGLGIGGESGDGPSGPGLGLGLGDAKPGADQRVQRPTPSPLNAYLLAPSFSAPATGGGSALSAEMLDWLEQLLAGVPDAYSNAYMNSSGGRSGPMHMLHRAMSRSHSSGGGGPQLPSPVPRERFVVLALKAKCFPLSVVAYALC